MAAETGPVGGPELLLALEPSDAGPKHEQLERRLRAQIRAGQLAPGARLPSSRALARALGISRGVVLEAYGQLTAEGYLAASQGAPTRVAAAPSAERPPLPAVDLRPRHHLRPAPRDPGPGGVSTGRLGPVAARRARVGTAAGARRR